MGEEDEDWDEALGLEAEAPPRVSGGHHEAAPPKYGGVNLRCGCYLLILLAAAGVVCGMAYYSPVPGSAMLGLWLWLNLLGVGYVSRVTERRPWFISRFGNYSEVIKVLVLAPLIYLVGPMHTLQPPTGCSLEWFLQYNLGCYVLPFFVGLNWTHLQRWKPLRGISLSPAGLRELAARPQAAIAVAAGLPLVAIALLFHTLLIYRSPVGWLYGVYAAALVGGVLITTVLLRHSHEIHLHHFFTTCVLIPFTGFRTPGSAVCQALLGGVYIEGAARFGMGYFIDQWSKTELGYRTEWSWCCIPLH